MQSLFERLESEVRYYCRDYPVVFQRAEGPLLYDREGWRYIDFLSGAGALNYGHNHPHLKRALLDYIDRNGIVHSLDLYTAAKHDFLDALRTTILEPRGLAHKVQFTGPTGTNAIEAALKLARKVTRRSTVVAFTNAFHGVSLGALATTASTGKRAAAGVPLGQVIRMPYEGFLGGDELRYVETMLTSPGNGLDAPAAFIIETVQGEGGLQAASREWMRRIAELARQLGALLIIDDIQIGCGRSGTFFSFEPFQIVPDIICLSKSLSGFGLPLSVVLIDPACDQWQPGEHNGTFRGHNLAFVTGAAALTLWQEPEFQAGLLRNVEHLDARLRFLCESFGHGALAVTVKGRGMLRGLELGDPALAARIKHESFERGLLLETCGPRDAVIKLIPPLNIDIDTLDQGLDVLTGVLDRALSRPARVSSGDA